MSWASDEWKSSLSHIALQKVEALEKSVDQLKKERDQKRLQVDKTDAALENQRKKTEEQKAQVLALKRDIANLEEKCIDADRNKEKVLHDLTTKDSKINCLESQLKKIQQSFEKETARSSKLQADYEHEVYEKEKTLRLLSEKSQEVNKLQTKLRASSTDSVFNSSTDAVPVAVTASSGAGHGYGDSLITFDDELVHFPKQKSISVGGYGHDFLAMEVQQVPDTSPTLRSASQASSNFNVFGVDPTSNVSTGFRQDADQAGFEWKLKIQKLQEELAARDKKVVLFEHEHRELSSKLSSTADQLTSKHKECSKFESEVLKLTTNLEQRNSRVTDLEQSLKQLQQQFECEHHNAQATLRSVEEKFKINEKNLREEMARDQQVAREHQAAMKLSVDDLERRLNETSREYQLLERNHRQLTVEKENLLRAVDEKKQELGRMKSESEAALEGARRQIEDAHKRVLNKYEVRLQERERELANASNELTKTKAELQEASRLLAESTGRCKDLEDKKAVAEKLVVQLEALKGEQERSTAEKMRELEKTYAKQLSDREEHNKNLSRSVEEQLRKTADVAKQLEICKREADDCKYKFESNQVHLDRLKKEKDQLEKENVMTAVEAEKRDQSLRSELEKCQHAEKAACEREAALKASLDRALHEAGVAKLKCQEACTVADRKSAELSGLSDELARMARHAEDRDRQLGLANTALSQLTDEKTKWKSEMDGLISKMEKLDKELVLKNQENSNLLASNRDLTDKVNEMRSALDGSACQMQQLERTLEARDEKWSREVSSIEEVKKRCEQANLIIDEQLVLAREKVVEQEALLSQTSRDLLALMNERNSLSASLDQQDERCRQAEAKFSDVSVKLDQSQQAFRDKCADMHRLEKELGEQLLNAKEEVRSKAEDCAELESRLGAALKDVDLLQQIKSRLECNLCLAEESNDSLLNEKCEWEGQLKELDRHYRESQSKISLLSAQLDDLQQVVDDKHKQVELARQSKRDLETEFGHMSKELQVANAELSEKISELECENARLSNLSEVLGNQQRDSDRNLADLERALQDAARRVDKLAAESLSLREQCKRYELKVEESENMYQSKEASYCSLEAEFENLEGELQLKTRSYEDLLCEKNQLVDALELLKLDHSKCACVLADMQSQMSVMSDRWECDRVALQAELLEKRKELDAVEQRVRQLEERLSQLEEVLRSRETEISERHCQISDLQLETVACHQRLDVVMAEKAATEKCLADANQSIELKTSVLAENVALIADVRRECAARLEQLSEQLSASEEERAMLMGRCSQLESESKQGQALLARKTEDYDRLGKELEDSRAELKRTSQLIAERDLELSNLGASMKLLGEIRDAAQSSLDESIRKIAQLEQLLRACVGEKEHLSRTLEERQDIVCELGSQLETQRREVSRFRDDLAACESRRESLEKDLCSQDEKIVSLSGQLSAERANLQATIENHTSAVFDLVTRCGSLERDLKEVGVALEKVSDDRRMLQERFDSSCCDWKAKEDDYNLRLVSANASLAEAQSELSNLELEFSTESARAACLEEKVSHLQTEKLDLQQALASAESTLACLEAEAASLRLSQQQLRSEIVALDSTVVKYQALETEWQHEKDTLITAHGEAIADKVNQLRSWNEKADLLDKRLASACLERDQAQSALEELAASHQKLVTNFETDWADLEAKADSFSLDMKQLSVEKSQLTASLTDLRNQVQEKDALLVILKAEMQNATEIALANDAKCRASLQALSSTVESKEADILRLEEARLVEQDRAALLGLEVKSLQDKLEGRLLEFSAERQQLESKILTLEDAVSRKDLENEACNRLLEETRSELASELLGFKQQLSDAQGDLTRARAEMESEIGHLLAAHESESCELRRCVEEKAHALRTLQDQHEKHCFQTIAEREQHAKEAADLKLALTEREAEARTLGSSVELLLDTIRLKESMEQLSGQRQKDLELEIQALISSGESERQSVARAHKSEVQLLEQALSDRTRELVESDRSIRQIKCDHESEVSSSTRTIADLSARVGELRKLNEEIRTDFEEKRVRADQHQCEVEILLKAEVNAISESLSRASEKRRVASEDRASACNQMQALDSQVAPLSEEKSTLTACLNALRDQLDGAYENLSKSRLRFQEEILVKEKDAESYRERLSSILVQSKDLQEAKTKSDSTVASLTIQVDELRKELDCREIEARIRLDDCERRWRSTTESLTALQAYVADTETKLHSAEATCDELGQTVSSLRCTVRDVEGDAIAKSDMIVDLQARLNATEYQALNLQSEFDKIANEKDRLRVTIEGLESENADVSCRLVQCQEREKDLETICKKNEAKCCALEAELVLAKEEASALCIDRDTAREVLQRTEMRSAELLSSVSALRTELDDAVARLKDERQTRCTMSSELNQLRGEVALCKNAECRYEQSIADLQSSLSNAQARNQALETELRGVNAVRDNLEKQCHDSVRALTEVQGKLVEADQRLDLARESLADVEERFRLTSDKLLSAESKYKSAVDIENQCVLKISDLESSKAELVRDCSTLRSELENLKSQHQTEATAKELQLTAVLADLEKVRASSQEALVALDLRGGELEEKTRLLDDLSVELATLTESLESASRIALQKDAALQGLAAEKEHISKLLTDAKRELEGAVTSLSDLESAASLERASTEERLETLQTCLHEKETLLADATEAKDGLAKALSKLQAELQGKESQLEDMVGSMDRVKSEKDLLESDLSEARAELQEKTRAIATLTLEHAEALQALDALNSEMKAKDCSLAALAGDKATLAASLQTREKLLEEKVAGLTADKEILARSLHVAQLEVQEKESLVGVAKAEAGALAESLHGVKADLTEHAKLLAKEREENFSLAESLQRVRAEVVNVCAERDCLRESVRRHVAESEEKDASIEKLTLSHASVVRTLGDVQSELSRAKASMDLLNSELKDARESLQSAKSDVDERDSLLANMVAERDRLATTLHSVREDFSDLKCASDAVSLEKEQVDEVLQQTKCELDSTKATLEAVSSKNLTLTESLEKVLANLATNSASLELLTSENEALAKSVELLRSDVGRHVDDEEASRSLADDLRRALDETKVSLALALDEQKVLTERLLAAESELGSRTSTLERLEADRIASSEALEDLRQSLAQRTREVEHLAGENGSLTVANADLRADLAEKSSALAIALASQVEADRAAEQLKNEKRILSEAMAEKEGDLARRLSSLRQSLDQCEAANAELVRQVGHATESREATRKELSACQEKEEVLRSDLSLVRHRLEVANAAREELERVLSQNARALEEANLQRDALKNDKDCLSGDCERLRQELHKAKADRQQEVATVAAEASERCRALEKGLAVKCEAIRAAELSLLDSEERRRVAEADVASRNVLVEELRSGLEQEKKRLKRLQKEIDKKDLSIDAIQTELKAVGEVLHRKDLEIAAHEKAVAELQRSLSLETQRANDYRARLDQVKASLLSSRANTGNHFADTDVVIGDGEFDDLNSHILRLQEQCVQLEREQKVTLDAAVEAERRSIIEASKSFVLEREKEYATRSKDLVDDLGLKTKQISNLSAKICCYEEQRKEYEFALERERQAYQDVLKGCEETEQQLRLLQSAASAKHSSDESKRKICELEEALSQSEKRVLGFKSDLSRMVEDYGKAAKLDMLAKDELQSRVDALQKLCSEKDSALARKCELFETTHEQLRQMGDNLAEAKRENENLRAQLAEFEGTRKSLQEALRKLIVLEAELRKLRSGSSALPLSTMSPIVSSLSDLRVTSDEPAAISTESRDGVVVTRKSVKPARSQSASAAKQAVSETAETPKRTFENEATLRSKKTRLSSIAESSDPSRSVHSTVSPKLTVTRRRSARVTRKPYQKTLPSSSSDDEVTATEKIAAGRVSSPEKQLQPHPQAKHPSPVLRSPPKSVVGTRATESATSSRQLPDLALLKNVDHTNPSLTKSAVGKRLDEAVPRMPMSPKKSAETANRSGSQSINTEFPTNLPPGEDGRVRQPQPVRRTLRSNSNLASDQEACKMQ